MPIYEATFRTVATWATVEIDATTSQEALQKAHELADTAADVLGWCLYDHSSVPLEEIEITGPGDAEVTWQSDDLALRLAASDLLATIEAQTDAAQAVIDAWAAGDLAAAVRTLDGVIPSARAAIAKAKGGAA